MSYISFFGDATHIHPQVKVNFPKKVDISTTREYKNTFWRLLTCKTHSDQRRVITSAEPHVNDNIARIYTEEIPLNDVVNAGFVLPSNIAMRDNHT